MGTQNGHIASFLESVSLKKRKRKVMASDNNNHKTWILFAMSAYSFDELKFTSAQKKEEKKQKTISKNPKICSA